MKKEVQKTGERYFLHEEIGGRLIELEESLGWIRITVENGRTDWLGCRKPVTVSFTSEDAQLIAAGINQLCRAIRVKGE